MNVDKLAEALCAAQAVMSGAKKASANPFFKSKYADLSAVFEAIKGPFADNGLAVTQLMGILDGRSTMTTRLMHSSGQYVESMMFLPEIADPQKIGSAITYYRRYMLMAIAGIPAEDDDGNGAVEAVKNRKPVDDLISDDELKAMNAVIFAYPDLVDIIKATCRVDSLRKVKKSQLPMCRSLADEYLAKKAQKSQA